MPCIQCPDGHWECGEDPSELCQGGGGFRQHSMISAPEGREVISKTSQVNTSGNWIKVGEFVARFEVQYRFGHDGKPVVKIAPLA